MHSILSLALICGIVEFVCFGFNPIFGQNMMDQPIVVGPLLGLCLGDLNTGIILGGLLEAVFLGAFSIGGSISLNTSIGTVLAVAYAITVGGSNKAAVALAVPLGLLGGMLEIGTYVLGAIISNGFDKAAEEGNEKKLTFLHYGLWFLRSFILSVGVFVAVLIGIKPVAAFIKGLPAFVTNGLALTGGVLPAVGFALLLSMVWEKKLAVWYFFGFILVEYLNLPLLAVAIVGLVFVIVFGYYDRELLNLKKQRVISKENVEIKKTSEQEEEDFLS